MAKEWATGSYGWHERTVLLPNFAQIKIYKRFTDDIFGLWIDPDLPLHLTDSQERVWFEDNEAWNRFKLNFPALGLIFRAPPPSRTKPFLDVTWTIRSNGTIHTKTYRKPANLHMYLPAASAHQQDTLKGLIFGSMIRYYIQNSDTADFIEAAAFLHSSLRNRGHSRAALDALYLEAGKHIDRKLELRQPLITRKCKKPKLSKIGDTLYLHWQFHPNGIKRHTLRELYRALLDGHTGFEKLVIAVSRPENIQDTLMSNNFERTHNKPLT